MSFLSTYLIGLVRPLDDDALDVVLERHVAGVPAALLDLLLLRLDDLGALLGEGEEGLALDVPADLVHGGGELMDLGKANYEKSFITE